MNFKAVHYLPSTSMLPIGLCQQRSYRSACNDVICGVKDGDINFCTTTRSDNDGDDDDGNDNADADDDGDDNDNDDDDDNDDGDDDDDGNNINTHQTQQSIPL